MLKNKVSGQVKTLNNSSNPDLNKRNSDLTSDSHFISAWDVLQKKDVEQHFLIENIIPGNVICLISGPSDTGKSILARQIALSAALGRSQVAGFHLNLIHNKSIYISTEDGISDWKEKLRKYSLQEDELKLTSNLKLLFEYDKFTPQILEKELIKDPVDVVVIDVFTDLYNADLNSAIQVRNYFTPFKLLAMEYGCTFIFIHHLNKKGEMSTPSKLNVSGSQGIESAMRCVIELRADSKDENSRHLIITKCNHLPPAEKKLSYKMLLKPNLEFEYSGERAPINNLSNAAPGLSPLTKHRVIELNSQGLPIRKIVEELSKEGTRVGRTTVNEIIRKETSAKTEVNLKQISEN